MVFHKKPSILGYHHFRKHPFFFLMVFHFSNPGQLWFRICLSKNHASVPSGIFSCIHMCQGLNSHRHPTFNWNSENGHVNPEYLGDDYPLLHGKNGSLDPRSLLIRLGLRVEQIRWGWKIGWEKTYLKIYCVSFLWAVRCNVCTWQGLSIVCTLYSQICSISTCCCCTY